MSSVSAFVRQEVIYYFKEIILGHLYAKYNVDGMIGKFAALNLPLALKGEIFFLRGI